MFSLFLFFSRELDSSFNLREDWELREPVCIFFTKVYKTYDNVEFDMNMGYGEV